MEAIADWRAQAVAAGWPPADLYVLAKDLRVLHAVVIFVSEDVVALRTQHGSLLRTLRDHSVECIARANRATEHLPAWIAPPEPAWCAHEGGCKWIALGTGFCHEHRSEALP